MSAKPSAGIKLARPYLAPACATPASRPGDRSGWPCSCTIAFTAAASSAHAAAARAMAAATAGHAGFHARPGHEALTGIHHHALATGFARGFLIAAAIMLLALIITAATIRIRRADLAGVNPI